MKSSRFEIWMHRFAWIQVVASLPTLVWFMFLETKGQIVLLGIVTMITWTATALAHVSAARTNLEVLDVDVDVTIENGKD